MTELESLKMKPESVEFRFVHKKHFLPVIISFDQPTGSGQFARARVTVGSDSMVVKFKPGRFKPRVADCKELAGFCLEKDGRLRSVAEAVSMLFGSQGAVGVRFELVSL